MYKLEDIIQDLKHDTPEVSVLEVIECLEQAQDTISDLQAKVDELNGELSIWKRRYNELYEAGIKLRSEYKKQVMGDRYIDGKCPSTCPNYKRQSEYIAEYRRIIAELEAKVEELDNFFESYGSRMSDE